MGCNYAVKRELFAQGMMYIVYITKMGFFYIIWFEKEYLLYYNRKSVKRRVFCTETYYIHSSSGGQSLQ